MTTFLLDLWHDLREKRLWPVAVGLLAAIVAVPVVLFKPASESVPAAIVPPKQNSAETLPVVAVDSGPVEGSRLGSFSEKNPFRPMKDLAKDAAAGSTKPKGGSSADSGTSAPSSGGSAGGGSSSAGSSAGSGPSTGSGSGGSQGAGTPSSGTPATPSVQWFHYTADFSFGEPGSPKKFKGATSFTLLPDDKKASIMFVGVTDDGGSAVFFISDPAFEAGGEGKCNAKGAQCHYVTLKVGDTSDEETFTAVDGSVSYDLRLTGIKREAVDGPKKGDAAPASPKRDGGLDATGAGVAATTHTSESLLPDLLASGPGVLRVGG